MCDFRSGDTGCGELNEGPQPFLSTQLTPLSSILATPQRGLPEDPCLPTQETQTPGKKK